MSCAAMMGKVSLYSELLVLFVTLSPEIRTVLTGFLCSGTTVNGGERCSDCIELKSCNQEPLNSGTVYRHEQRSRLVCLH